MGEVRVRIGCVIASWNWWTDSNCGGSFDLTDALMGITGWFIVS